jgi:hypothetical protein
MNMKYVALAAGGLAAARFAWLIWSGWRTGQVKGPSPWLPAVDRTRVPALYWMRMATHAIVVAVIAIVIVGALLGYL